MHAHENPTQAPDTTAMLKAEGVPVPEGVTVNVAVDARDVRTLVIPLPPIGELSDGELSTVYGGTKCGLYRVAECVISELLRVKPPEAQVSAARGRRRHP
jgi:hypothetical protein